jgi:hypothetical protein
MSNFTNTLMAAVVTLAIAPGALAARPTAIPPRGPAVAEPAPPAPTEPAPLPESAAAIHKDPDSYVVPESWREPARALVEPGESGLPGGLELVEVELGNRITATYRGESGELKVDVVAPAVAPEGAAWVGKRLALVVVSTTLPDGGRDAALARVRQLLEGRELGWSWFRRPPGQAARDAAQESSLAVLRTARRLAWTGEGAAARAEVDRALAGAAETLPLMLEASRILYRAGDRERAAELGEAAGVLALKAMGAKATTLDAAGKDRLRLALAISLALAGESANAAQMTRDLVARTSLGCEAAAVAEELDRTGAFAEAAQVAEQVVALDPTCDAAWAIGIDVARHRGQAEDAVARGERAVEARPVVVLARAALARALLAANRAEDSLRPARVAVTRSDAAQPVLSTLAAVAARGVATAEVLEDWSGQAARYPKQPASVALGALACWLSNEGACAAERFARTRELAGGHAPGTRALEALMQVQNGQLDAAAATEQAAWDEPVVDLTHVAASAALAEARGQREQAVRAWTAYVDASTLEFGPIPVGVAAAKLRALTGADVAAAADATAGGVTVPASAPARGPLWPWFLGACLVVVAAWWWTSREPASS